MIRATRRCAARQWIGRSSFSTALFLQRHWEWRGRLVFSQGSAPDKPMPCLARHDRHFSYCPTPLGEPRGFTTPLLARPNLFAGD
ncbi:MAG: hypothetical protein ACRD4Q_15855 [Candidatus Acidiferrales bacterium]